jgi:hypothetical protein
MLRGAIERGVERGVFRADVGADFLARYLVALFPAYVELREAFPAAELQERLTRVVMAGILVPARVRGT